MVKWTSGFAAVPSSSISAIYVLTAASEEQHRFSYKHGMFLNVCLVYVVELLCLLLDITTEYPVSKHRTESTTYASPGIQGSERR